jgi:hypothetical protein
MVDWYYTFPILMLGVYPCSPDIYNVGSKTTCWFFSFYSFFGFSGFFCLNLDSLLRKYVIRPDISFAVLSACW